MNNNSILSILHLSDFHYSKKKYREQEIVLDALANDLESLCLGHRKPDLIYFTGDLVNAGGLDSHEEAYDRFISRMASATGCAEERIFVLPGNHDLNQNFVETNVLDQVRWRSLANDMAALNAAYESGEFSELLNKFKAYDELSEYMNSGTRTFKNPFCSVHHIEPLNIDLFSINTAALSFGGLKGYPKDDGLLGVPEYAIRDALKHLKPKSFKIFGTHHPIGTLSEQAGRYLRSVIQREADLHLFGHMHDPLGAQITSFAGTLYSDQAGAVFTARKGAYIGYSLLCVERDRKLFETHLRTYFNDRPAFDEARDVVENGRFYSSQEAREFWRTIATPVEDAKFRAILSGSCFELFKSSPDQVKDNEKPVHELFITPPIVRPDTPESDDLTSTGEKDVSFETIVNGFDNVIIMGFPEYGKTTLLNELQYRLLEDAQKVPLARLPVMLDFSDIRYNSDQVLQTLRGRSLIQNSTDYDIESLLKLGLVCVLCDDVNFEDRRRVAALRDFVSRYPKARYVFSSLRRTSDPMGAKISPEMPVRFDTLELRILRRGDMRQLITKFNDKCDVDVVLDRIQDEIGHINIPFTAANGSIFMIIFEEQSGFRPINRSVLVEQFIDICLRKGSIEQSQRETFDYKNKTSMLASIAAWMARENQYIVDEEDLRSEMRRYIDGIGLNADIGNLLGEFLTSRIFVKRPEGRIAFRYRAVSEYFVSLEMVNNRSFRDWVLADERYLSYLNEIQYYAGKLRNDGDLVDLIASRYDDFMSELVAEHGMIDISVIPSLQLPQNDGGAGSLDYLASQLAEGPLPIVERDAELDATLPRDVEDRQEVFRPEIGHIGNRFMLMVLLYSGVLKNMELISDADKRRHLHKVWGGWATFLHLSLQVVRELALQRKIRINGVLYEISAPKGMPDEEVARAIALNLPVGISRWISSTLGTEKLERQLTEPGLEDVDSPLVYEMFRASLIADLKLPATASAINAALERLADSRYLTQALIWKIADLRRYDRLRQNDFDRIAGPIANALADLKGGDSKTKASERERQLVRLKREDFVMRLRRQQHRDE